MLISWKHDAAFNDIRQIRALISRQRVIDPGLKFSDFDQTQLASDFGDLSDPWGNQYQIIERDQISLPNSDATFHAFSFGLDGISKSNGDDPDDINSWGYDRSRYYGAMIRDQELRSNLWRTVWVTPILYLMLLFLVGRFRQTHGNAG